MYLFIALLEGFEPHRSPTCAKRYPCRRYFRSKHRRDEHVSLSGEHACRCGQLVLDLCCHLCSSRCHLTTCFVTGCKAGGALTQALQTRKPNLNEVALLTL